MDKKLTIFIIALVILIGVIGYNTAMMLRGTLSEKGLLSRLKDILN